MSFYQIKPNQINSISNKWL